MKGTNFGGTNKFRNTKIAWNLHTDFLADFDVSLCGEIVTNY
jgi:hypothetical protein